MQGLTEQQTRECVKAAGLKLEYPGTLAKALETGPAAAADITQADREATAAALQAGLTTANAGREVKGDGAVITSGAAVANDLASLHAIHTGRLAKYENVLGQKMSGTAGGRSFVEQVSVVLLVVAAVWLGCSRLRNRTRVKVHGRSE